VARRIRRAERHESALLDLNATVTVIYERLLELFHRAEGGQNAAQFTEARQAVEQMRMHWESKSSGVISDDAIVTAYAYFSAAVQEGLSGGATLARASRPGAVIRR